MVLNDVGAWHDYVMTDVSRGWPCNGKFNERQALLYNIALETSNHMFSLIKPGMPMKDVDGESHRYCAQLLKDARVLDDVGNIGKYMWHGGAHHVGFDVHDAVETPETIAPQHGVLRGHRHLPRGVGHLASGWRTTALSPRAL